MSKNSVKTILITLYLSAVQDPEPLSASFFIFSHGFQKHVTTIHPDGISSPSLYVCFEDSSC